MKNIETDSTLRHPCYNGGCKNARIHLPVVPSCNISCNYCNRRYDCVNESRPGVCSEILTPAAAADKYLRVKTAVADLQVAGIAGPGDPLADFDKTEETFRLIREIDPDVIFCLSTNGLYLERYAKQIKKSGVTHVTVTINTLCPETGAVIYKEVTYDGAVYTGEAAAGLLLEKQFAGLKKLRDLGITVKVNTVLIKGVNDDEIENIAKTASEYGAYAGNIMQLIPAPGSAFENMPLASNAELNEARKRCSAFLRQIYHCQQCRADAVGVLGQDRSAEFSGGGTKEQTDSLPKGRLTMLVTSSDRRIINQHFGHADKFYVYQYEDGAIRLLEVRDVIKYCEGPRNCTDEGERIDQLIKATTGCDVILTMRIGLEPQRILERQGKKVLATYGFIGESIHKAAHYYLRKEFGLGQDRR
jgi:MoaA/NifB/PqqE/SkfB family radical SAM enzyme